MRFVPIKNVEQQAVLALHRARQGFAQARTAQANQIRGLLGEFGLIVPQGIGYIASRVPELIEDAERDLPGSFRVLVQRLLDHLQSPLQLANPHGHASQLGSVFVQLNAQHIGRAGKQLHLALQLQHLGLGVGVYFGWRPNLPDEADNHLVELAVAGAAQRVITRNLCDVARGELRFPGLKVVDPATFLKELEIWKP